jgi:large subunit ribosomal protein L9
MKVILKEKVKTLGNVGEIVNVSAGHARNYLIPNGWAVSADDSNKKQAAHMERLLAKRVAGSVAEANELKGKIDGLSLELIKKVGASGKLFGTVTNAELSKELETRGIEVERRLISLKNPIKAVGTYEATVKLSGNVEATFGVKVRMSDEQAAKMKVEAEAAAAAKKKRAEAAPVDGEGEEVEATEEVVKTEEQILQETANKILRG